MNKNIEKIVKNISKSPGVYLFLNQKNKIIYIGKSVNLKSRVNSYFNPSNSLNFAKKKMVSEIKNIENILTNTENEALILETNLIKKHKPKYNVLMKDDKNHTYIKITDEEIPKVIKTRKKTKDGKYFGPFISTTYVNNILKFLKKKFGQRSCNLDFVKNDNSLSIKNKGTQSIPCLDYYIGTCSGPCLLDYSSIDKYKNNIEKINAFLSGDIKDIVKDLESEMIVKAKNLEFEKAKNLKDDIDSIKQITDFQIVRDFIGGDLDVVGYLEKYEKTFIGVIEIRDGKLVSIDRVEVENKLLENKEDLLRIFLERRYFLNEKKLNLLLPFEIQIDKIIKQMKLEIEFPKIGQKIELLNFCLRNLSEFAYKQKLDSLSVKRFLKSDSLSLLTLLGYFQINKNMIFECYDISHLSGSYTVASKSVFSDSKPDKKLYRKYKIKTLEDGKIDDFASLKEVFYRRLVEMDKTGFIPDLIIIDGGKGQLSSVSSILNDFKFGNKELIKEKIQLVSIAKREEELFLPGNKTSIILNKESLGLRLLQSLRDEAHRFAVGFNRGLRIKESKKNILESLPSIGPKTRKEAIIKFGSVQNLKNFKEEEIRQVFNKKQYKVLVDHDLV